ncbi:MAG: restriction endonuclease subunit S [Nitrospirota bacterium]
MLHFTVELGILKKIKVHKMWFYWMLKAVTKTIEEEAHGIIGMVHVTKGMLGGMKIPLPPSPEQQSIADYLDHKTAKIDETTQTIHSQLEKLKEYRQALISNVVTGKVRIDKYD